jgi:PPOX class probable F420-dependent enzyme
VTTHDLDRLSAGKYLSLTTFRRDGSAVATPVWVTRDGDHLYVITSATSGKVKRLRNNASVQLAPCDVRGRESGPQAAGTARLLDDAGTRRVSAMVDQKYGLLARVLGFRDRLRARRGHDDRVGLELTLT